jgi:hypothetical protein
MADYAGISEHSAYGGITIREENGNLCGDLNETIEFWADHWHDDAFEFIDDRSDQK